MSFKDMLAEDLRGVFLNADEFAERRTIVYDGEIYADIPVVLTGIKEQNRQAKADDHAPGLYLASTVLHCALDALGGNLPEQGSRIRISDPDAPGYFRQFYVATSDLEMGMVRCGLEAIDE